MPETYATVFAAMNVRSASTLWSIVAEVNMTTYPFTALGAYCKQDLRQYRIGINPHLRNDIGDPLIRSDDPFAAPRHALVDGGTTSHAADETAGVVMFPTDGSYVKALRTSSSDRCCC
jgi:hypothetical protein